MERELLYRLKPCSKRLARKLFNDGTTVFAIPHNLSRFYMDGLFILEFDPYAETTFDTAYNSATYYNCDYERGYYLNFLYDPETM